MDDTRAGFQSHPYINIYTQMQGTVMYVKPLVQLHMILIDAYEFIFLNQILENISKLQCGFRTAKLDSPARQPF